MTNAELIAWQNRLQSPVEKALRRAFHLGQTYCQQADSESYSQNRRSDETLAKFEELVASMQAEAPQATKDAEDAARYRKLRAMHWNGSPLCVVVNPKDAVKLGHDCPYGLRLDEAIDAARKSQGEQERTPEQLARDLQTNQEIDAMVEKMKGQP